MGMYDFSCNVRCKCISYDGYKDVLRIYCYWKNNGWTYHMQPVYGWVTCNGEERQVYGPGYPNFTGSNQGEYLLGYSDFTIYRGQSDKSSSYSARLRSDSSYVSGSRSSSSGVYVTGKLASHTVSYNANGGTGAPSNQTKIYGQTLKLSTVTPKRQDYNFKGWATSSGGVVAYNPGGNYTDNKAITLYAVWELAYVKPRLSNVKIYRCDASGNQLESGTYIRTDFTYATDLSGVYIKLQYKKQTDSSWIEKTIITNSTDKNATVTKKIYGDGAISTEISYVARILCYDSKGTSYTTYSSEFPISTVIYPIDVRKGRKRSSYWKSS